MPIITFGRTLSVCSDPSMDGTVSLSPPSRGGLILTDGGATILEELWEEPEEIPPIPEGEETAEDWEDEFCCPPLPWGSTALEVGLLAVPPPILVLLKLSSAGLPVFFHDSFHIRPLLFHIGHKGKLGAAAIQVMSLSADVEIGIPLEIIR